MREFREFRRIGCSTGKSIGAGFGWECNPMWSGLDPLTWPVEATVCWNVSTFFDRSSLHYNSSDAKYCGFSHNQLSLWNRRVAVVFASETNTLPSLWYIYGYPTNKAQTSSPNRLQFTHTWHLAPLLRSHTFAHSDIRTHDRRSSSPLSSSLIISSSSTRLDLSLAICDLQDTSGRRQRHRRMADAAKSFL